MNGKSKLSILIVLFIFSSAAPASTDNANFRAMYVFGDSLSDMGNVYFLSQGRVPPDTRYKRGRFSNGRIWVDRLANVLRLKRRGFFASNDPRFEIGRGGGSYAHGASGTDYSNGTPLSTLFPVSLPVVGLLGQVEDFATDIGPNKADPEALYVVWSGPNDYLLSGQPGTNIPYPPNPDSTVDRIGMAVERLYDLGAENILVLNMPDLGSTPIAAALDQQIPGIQQQLTNLTGAHNELLLQEMVGYKGALTGLRLYYLDVASLFTLIAENPDTFGFTNTFEDLGPASNCLFQVTSDPQNCDPLPDGFDAKGSVFWDEEHPSEDLQKIIAITASLCLKIPLTCELP